MNTNKESISKKKPLYNITPFSLLDYPNKTSCIVWFSGCGMRCEFCYNIEIVENSGNYSYLDAIEFLKSRKGLLQGVVLCGGEPLFAYDKDMLFFIKEIKNMGFLIKLDTNGVAYEALKELLELKLIDYVALDFKAPQEKFEFVTKNSLKNYNLFLKSLKLLIDSKLEFEVRTTYHPELLSIEDLRKIILTLEELGYNQSYYIQSFLDSKENFGSLQKVKNPRLSEFLISNNFKIIYRNF
ncbi:MAG: anaerobic ribonucleoside-triphosphate reductase activating protein [Arcobacteraceae bacterium]|nr:anaerobic ribonucleoside-triphosphate reductase activating protein [Arcobacteraceae bacterium]